MKTRAKRQPFFATPKPAAGVPVHLKTPGGDQSFLPGSLLVCPSCDLDEFLAFRKSGDPSTFLQCLHCSTVVQLGNPPTVFAEGVPAQNQPAQAPGAAELPQEPAQEPAQAPGAAELPQEPPEAQIVAEPYQEPAQEPSGKKGKKSWREDR